MAEVTGSLGSVTFATGYAANVNKWTIKYSSAAEDVTDFVDGAAGNRSFIPSGIKEWSGSYGAVLDGTTKLVAPGAAAATATFTATTGRTYGGSIIVTTVDIGEVEVGKAIPVAVTFQGSGALDIG